MFIGHMDTVFPDQEARKRPYTVTQHDGVRVAKGPGILDMKSGLLMGMYALHLLITQQQDTYHSVTFICNSDEEIGSLSSKALISRLAKEMDAVMVLEPGRQLNAVVSARKGIGHYRVEVEGIAAHAGVEPDKGRSAILELAHQVVALQALNGTVPGATLNVGIMHGGERTNVIPDSAYCELDIRVSDHAGLEAIEAAMHSITAQPTVQGTKVTLSGGIRALPFERNERSTRLLRLAQEAASELGLTLEDVASGGASDANTTAGMGLPTIDGLGPAGGLAHNPDEYIELDTLPIRVAFISKLVQHICASYQHGNQL
jgi:glutamate carboxypeptidase